MMAYSEDHIALAAEYALGTLDADERAQVETMMSVDKDFTAMVQAWEYRLGVLNQMVGSVEPRPEVWDKIRDRDRTFRAAGAAGAARGSAAAARGRCERRRRDAACPRRPRTIPTSSGWPAGPGAGAMSRRFTSAIAAALVAMIAMQVYQPDLLPDGIRPKPRTQVVEVKTPPPPAPSAQYVARAAEGRRLARLHSHGRRRDQEFHGAQGRRPPEPGKSYELWIVSDKLQRPRSLGVIGGNDFTARPVLSAL